MKKRVNFKRIITVLCVLLCAEAGTFGYLVTFRGNNNNYTRNLDLGNKYLLSEDYDDAVKLFTKAIDIDEKKEEAYIGRGDAYKAKGDYVSAWEDYEIAQDLLGDTDLLRARIGATDIEIINENGEGVAGAIVELEGNSHSYEFVTDNSGHVVEPIFPEKYTVKVVTDGYEPIENQISAEGGGFVAEPIRLDNKSNKESMSIVIEKYKAFIQSKDKSYRIYDIDKDGFPELFFSEFHYEEREAFCDIYAYNDGEFSRLDRTYDFVFWQSYPKYASYPNGNGIVQYSWGKGREIITIETWDAGKNNSQEVYFTDFIKDHSKSEQVYYKDTADDAYETVVNHQFYQSETSCPYFEGSYLLGYNAKDNFTALYEAFGVEESDAISENDNNAFMGIKTLTQGVESNIVTNGRNYKIKYDSTEKSDEYVRLDLYTNDSIESYRLDAVYYPSIEKVYVTDIDIDDSYSNIIVVIGGEDDASSTYILAFSSNEISMITEFIGRLVPESVSGNGTVLLEYGNGMGIRDYGSFMIRPEISVHDLTAGWAELHSGRGMRTEIGYTFEEGYEVPLYSDLTVYGEPSCRTIVGTIPAGNSVICEYADYVRYDGSFYVTGGEVRGYVTGKMLKSSCDDIFFVG